MVSFSLRKTAPNLQPCNQESMASKCSSTITNSHRLFCARQTLCIISYWWRLSANNNCQSTTHHLRSGRRNSADHKQARMRQVPICSQKDPEIPADIRPCCRSWRSTVYGRQTWHRVNKKYEMIHTSSIDALLKPLPMSGQGGLVAEWLACWTQVQKGPGSNHSRDAVG